MSHRRVLFLLPPPATPRLVLRNQATEAVRVSADGRRWRWRCPFCGARAKGRLRRRAVATAALAHEPWCPVL